VNQTVRFDDPFSDDGQVVQHGNFSSDAVRDIHYLDRRPDYDDSYSRWSLITSLWGSLPTGVLAIRVTVDVDLAGYILMTA
jgi:hypothetical protein